MKQKEKFGFIGTSGLAIMLASGTFIAAFALFIVYKWMNGMTAEQSVPMFGTLFLGGVFPYIAGTMMFWWGKRIREKRGF